MFRTTGKKNERGEITNVSRHTTMQHSLTVRTKVPAAHTIAMVIRIKNKNKIWTLVIRSTVVRLIGVALWHDKSASDGNRPPGEQLNHSRSIAQQFSLVAGVDDNAVSPARISLLGSLMHAGKSDGGPNQNRLDTVLPSEAIVSGSGEDPCRRDEGRLRKCTASCLVLRTE
jgi:hypothetical protein